MTTYNNGPGNVPRLPDAVVDTLIRTAHRNNVDPTAAAVALVHDACEELLARLPDDAARISQLEVTLLLIAQQSIGSDWTAQQAFEFMRAEARKTRPYRK
jgi:hypothetical protein